ncbi:MAG: PepSY domain-containing protein [Halobacteriovoraceae bacterium]|nr:PepSY domain-containing protein [Halobacteriovoraceae bacterium]
MKKFLSLIVLVSTLNGAMAKDNCTDQPKEKWMPVEKFKELVISKGFKIKKFKQPGSCYEIYGTDKNGKEVEVYFNPVDAKIVKLEVED